jgi:S1-C subfamily serine protease
MLSWSRSIVALVALLALPAAAQVRGPGDNRMREAVQAVVGVTAYIPESARSARTLGTERNGSGIVIGSDGLVLTVGYLVLESERVVITTTDDQEIEGKMVAFDFDTGFGLVRGRFPGRVRAVEIGSAADLKHGSKAFVASRIADLDVREITVVARREFAGYWEYLLSDAIFTAPQYPAFGGAPLLTPDGRLAGIGSLAVRNAASETTISPGNMFIPIDQLKPVLGDLLALGQRSGREKPWLGIWTAESNEGGLAINFVSPDSPSEKAGLRRGDIIVGIDGQPISGQADFYRKLWSAGAATPHIALTIRRGTAVIEQRVAAVGRSSLFRTKDAAK